MNDDDPKPPHVWWSPTSGVLVRHERDRERFSVVADAYGFAFFGGDVEWPGDGKLLRAEHADYRGRAELWERTADRFGRDADARVARAEANEASAVAEAARLRAKLLELKAADGDVTTPDDLRQVRAKAYADGVLAGRAGISDTGLPGSNNDEEDGRG